MIISGNIFYEIPLHPLGCESYRPFPKGDVHQRLMSISEEQGSRKEMLDSIKCGMTKKGFTKITVYFKRQEKGKQFTGATVYTCSDLRP